MAIADFFSSEEKEQIVAAIKQAEQNTSGEIRLHVESKCKGEVLDSAAYWFKKLDMHQTAARNGVLFYLAVDSKKFAIIGDAALHAKVGEGFWKEVTELVQQHFQQKEFVRGLSLGILRAGEKLKIHFPYQKDDKNELPDDISFGK